METDDVAKKDVEKKVRSKTRATFVLIKCLFFIAYI